MAKRRNRNRPVEILLTSFLIALFLLIGIASMLWVVQSGALSGPTPTPTATSGPSATPTADFRATRITEDMLTQVAYSVILATKAAEMVAGLTPSPTTAEAPPTQVELLPEAAPEEATPTPDAIEEESVLITDVNVLLPVVAGENPLESIATTQAELPNATTTVDAPLADSTPTAIFVETDTPTPTPETPTPVPPTPTPLPPATPIPTPPIVVSVMKGVIGGSEAKGFVGPGSNYTATNPLSLAPQTTINVLGRDAAGEWLYMCCFPNTNTVGWVRSARVSLVDNPTPVSAPPNTDGNDLRLLPLAPLPANVTPIATPTPIPPDDFPLYRRDSGNRARVPTVPYSSFQFGWPNPGQASGPFQTGVVVYGTQVLAASTDNHLYSFDRFNGSQRWRYNTGEVVTLTPAVVNGVFYVMTPSGRLLAIDENGGLRWQQAHGLQPQPGMISGVEHLYVIGRAGASDHLMVLSQSTGSLVRDWAVPEGDLLRAPAVGGQLIFAAGVRLWALDAYTFELVWQSDPFNFVSAPVYVTPGVRAAAELYVAAADGRVLAFDANTGRRLWDSPGGMPLATLAVNNNLVVGVGTDGVTVRAFSRDGGAQTWAQNSSIGQIVGGPILDNERLLIASSNGAFQLIETATGAPQPVNVQLSSIVGSIAVSGPYIFAATNQGQVFAIQQSP